MGNMDYWDKLKSVPEEMTKTIGGGRLKGMTDIKPQWRLQRMTEIFGPIGIGWTYEITDKWTYEENVAEETSAHVSIILKIKNGDEWSEGIPGIGGSKLIAQEKSGPHHSDEAYKMALTDALSVAMKQLGVAADIYMGGGADKSKYDEKPKVPAKEYGIILSMMATGQIPAAEHGKVTGYIEENKYYPPNLKTVIAAYEKGE